MPGLRKNLDGNNDIQLREIRNNFYGLGQAYLFDVRVGTPIKNMIELYCRANRVRETSVIFMYNGQQINAEDTPESLNMKCGDVIEIIHE